MVNSSVDFSAMSAESRTSITGQLRRRARSFDTKGKKMSHPQIDWIKESNGSKKIFRAMVVGWQNATYAINSLVDQFNNQYLDEENRRKDSHYGMKEIAIKKQIVAALHQLKPCLDHWCTALIKDDKLSEELRNAKANIREELKKVEKFKDIRNMTFHFGDPLEDPDTLVGIYEDIDRLSLAELNEILKAVISFGNSLKGEINQYC